MRRDILIGFILGLLANAVGVFIYVSLFMKRYSVLVNLEIAWEEGIFGNIVAVGALANFVFFFLFINKKPYRARGVLMATMLAAIFILINRMMS